MSDKSSRFSKPDNGDNTDENTSRISERPEDGLTHDMPMYREVWEDKKKVKKQVCANCGALNDMVRTFCVECSMDIREGQAIYRKKSNPAVKIHFPKLEGILKCPHCGSLNNEKEEYCRECRMALRELEKQEVRKRFMKDMLLEEGENLIRCSVCGYDNQPHVVICEDCGLPVSDTRFRETSLLMIQDLDQETLLSEFIQCGNCGALNPHDADFCKDCQGALKDNPESETNEDGQKRQTRVKLIYPGSEGFVFCDNCGACIREGPLYCPQCAGPIKANEPD